MGKENSAAPAEKVKRKTHTSAAVKRRYNNKVYGRIAADLPKDLVAKFKEVVAENNTSIAAVFREAMEAYIEQHSDNIPK